MQTLPYKCRKLLKCFLEIAVNYLINRNEEKMEIKTLQQELLKMMKNFHQVCEANNLKYYLLGGSALGAIRHKGFIPWDDDMDVGMPRYFYDEFCKKAQTILPPYLEIRYYKNTNKSPFHFVKLINKNTTLIENSYTNYVEGVYIDVFPLDNMKPNDVFENIRYKLIKISHSFVMKHASTKKQITIKSKIFTPLAKILPLKVLHSFLEYLMTKNTDEKSSAFCNFLGSWGLRELVSKSVFGEPVLYKFEDSEFYGPKNSHAYLTSLYGNYMQPPPKKDQVCRHNYHYVNLNLPYRDYIKEHIK